jgi:hypothetical protein
MTFKVTAKTTKEGVGVPGLLVIGNDEITGESFMRSTDGNGYADVAMLGSCKIGDRVTLSIEDPQYRFIGQVRGDSLVITTEDQEISVALVPFV